MPRGKLPLNFLEDMGVRFVHVPGLAKVDGKVRHWPLPLLLQHKVTIDEVAHVHALVAPVGHGVAVEAAVNRRVVRHRYQIRVDEYLWLSPLGI